MLKSLAVYSNDIPKKRYAICKSCEHLKSFICDHCNCLMKIKVLRIESECPLKKWGPKDYIEDPSNKE